MKQHILIEQCTYCGSLTFIAFRPTSTPSRYDFASSCCQFFLLQSLLREIAAFVFRIYKNAFANCVTHWRLTNARSAFVPISISTDRSNKNGAPTLLAHASCLTLDDRSTRIGCEWHSGILRCSSRPSRCYIGAQPP